jgi:hypothetical protein
MNSKFAICCILTLCVFLYIAGFTTAQHPAYDFIISGGHIVDGTGALWVAGDIGIVRDRIVAIGDLSQDSSSKRIDASDPCHNRWESILLNHSQGSFDGSRTDR